MSLFDFYTEKLRDIYSRLEFESRCHCFDDDDHEEGDEEECQCPDEIQQARGLLASLSFLLAKGPKLWVECPGATVSLNGKKTIELLILKSGAIELKEAT